MTTINEEQDNIVFQGDTIIIPFEYEQGEISGISDFSDYDKIVVKVSCLNDYVTTFSTNVSEIEDSDHLITLTDNQHFDLIIPASDTVKMNGSLTIKAILFLTYLGKSMNFSYKFDPQTKVIE